MNPLLFRRQFILSPKPHSRLKAWQHAKAGPYTLLVHPDCPLTCATHENRTALLVGYALDPRKPKATDADLAMRMARSETVEGISICLYGLSGRFLVFLIERDTMRIFPDACGLRSLFWTLHDGQFYAATQPTLLGKKVTLTPSVAYDQYFKSQYIKNKPEHYHPAGVSLFEGVHQLVPNHYLEVATGRKQRDRVRHTRFYPSRPLTRLSLDEGVDAFTELLSGSLDAASRRSRLAVALSAGLDSRLILAAAGPFVSAFTFINRDPAEMKHDLDIPAALAERFGFAHHVIDARKPMDQRFRAFYNANTDIPHSEHWGRRARAMHDLFANGQMAVKGDGGEIMRRYHYRYSRHPRITSHHYFLNLLKQWKGIPFIAHALRDWFNGVRPSAERTGHQLLDLYYWEHGMGGWMARNQLEWDISQEVFTPFNNRELLEIALGVDELHRRLPDNTFFIRAIEKLWPDLLLEPIYPQKTQSRRIRKGIKKLLMKIGILRSKKPRES